MTVENAIGTWTGSLMKETYRLGCNPGDPSSKCGMSMTGYDVDQAYDIFGIDRNDTIPQANSKLLGSIAYLKQNERFAAVAPIFTNPSGVTNLEFKDVVSFIPAGAFTNKRAVFLDATQGAADMYATNITGHGGVGVFTHSAWQVSGVSSAPTTMTSGTIFTQNAGICKRYVSGVLTSQPLWPWPMNQRIINAMTAAGRTPVDVTATIEAMFGKIPAHCSSTLLTITMSPPRNLKIVSTNPSY
jgi:hypothetical protein